MQQVLPLCDLVVGTEEEMHILGGSDDTIAAIRECPGRDRRIAGLQARRRGLRRLPGDIPPDVEDGLLVQGFPVEVFNVLGAGDAFMAGFLRGWLQAKADRAMLRARQCLRRHRRFAPRLRAGDADEQSSSQLPAPTDLPFALREDDEPWSICTGRRRAAATMTS